MKYIYGLSDDLGKIHLQPVQIMKILHGFYSKLYAGQTTATETCLEFLEKKPFRELAKEHSDFMNKQFTTQEISETIKQLKNNKTTGNDGFPSEFYKVFKLDSIEHLINLFNNILETGEVPKSLLESNIILIPKENSLNPGSYWPIALINTMHFFPEILANKLSKIITRYIHTHQTGFIPTRQLADNIHRTLNTITTCQIKKTRCSYISD